VLHVWNTFISVIISWCSIKDDYRTLVELEGVSVVNSSHDYVDEKDSSIVVDESINRV
jgi:hypothetical protein